MDVTLQRHALGLTWYESTGTARTSHALLDSDTGSVYLIDPFEYAPALDGAAQLGTIAAVIQLLDRHNRDGQAIARRLGIPLHRLPSQADAAGTPFTPFSIVSNRAWNEVGLWWEAQRALIVPEAVGTVEAFALGRRLGVHPMLRLTPPRKQLSGYVPERLFVGHGPPLETDAASALTEALDHARGDATKLVTSLPKLIRRARKR